MRALSLWQPWASAIAFGHKQIETRHWSTSYRGPLAIHAAKRWTREERETAAMFAQDFDVRLAAPPLGAIVAIARLTSIESTEKLARGLSELEESFGNYAPGRFGWRLEDVRALATPIPYVGHQGLFDIPDQLLLESPPQPPQGRLL